MLVIVRRCFALSYADMVATVEFLNFSVLDKFDANSPALIALMLHEDYDLSDKNIRDEDCKVIAVALQPGSLLKDLNLAGNNMGSQGCNSITAALKQNTSLKKLNSTNNSTGDGGLNASLDTLKHKKNLQELGLNDNGMCNSITKNLFTLVQLSTGLKKLFVGGGSDDTKATNLLRACKNDHNLQDLDLGQVWCSVPRLHA